MTTHCRTQLSATVNIPVAEERLHTLPPNVCVNFTALFTRDRTGTGGEPLTMYDPAYLSHRSAKYGAHGIDGLVSDSYILKLAPQEKWRMNPS